MFHVVPIPGNARRILRKSLLPMMRSKVIPKRDLRLVRLHGASLRRLRVTHSELIESSSSQYSRTAAWGQALYDHADYDGLVWRSRQFNDSYALMLWGHRVDRFNDLDPDPTNAHASALRRHRVRRSPTAGRQVRHHRHWLNSQGAQSFQTCFDTPSPRALATSSVRTPKPPSSIEPADIELSVLRVPR